VLPASVPPALPAITVKAMSSDRAARYADALALLADIDRFEQGLAVEAWSEPLWHRLRRLGVAQRRAALAVRRLCRSKIPALFSADLLKEFPEMRNTSAKRKP